MAEYIVQDTSLTPIADEIRVLSGVSNKLSLSAMAKNTKDANSEVDTQTDLLAQVLEALSGKAGGGLPDGVSAIACGSFTPTEDISGTYVITHNLDAVPNFWSVTAIGPIDLASKPYGMLSQSFYKITTVRSDGVTLAGSRLIQYCTASGKGAITSSNVSNISGACTFSNIYLSGSTSWKLVAGVTYIWVVGVIDGLK